MRDDVAHKVDRFLRYVCGAYDDEFPSIDLNAIDVCGIIGMIG
jgi:hypothetical protein